MLLLSKTTMRNTTGSTRSSGNIVLSRQRKRVASKAARLMRSTDWSRKIWSCARVRRTRFFGYSFLSLSSYATVGRAGFVKRAFETCFRDVLQNRVSAVCLEAGSSDVKYGTIRDIYVGLYSIFVPAAPHLPHVPGSVKTVHDTKIIRS